MSYDYATERPKLFTDQGQRLFLQVRDAAQSLLKSAGAFRFDKLSPLIHGGYDSWTLIACADRLVELGEIEQVYRLEVATQHQVYTFGPANRS